MIPQAGTVKVRNCEKEKHAEKEADRKQNNQPCKKGDEQRCLAMSQPIWKK